MMSNPTLLATIALLLPVASFLTLALLAPFRRLGRPAGVFSALCALGALVAAIAACESFGNGGGPEVSLLNWLPSSHGPMATIGVMVDADSSMMLILVALVATLVQVYRSGISITNPVRRLAATTPTSRCLRFR